MLVLGAILILALLESISGKMTVAVPRMLRVAVTRMVGKVSPPSVDRKISTNVQLTGEPAVPLTLQLTVIAPPRG
ncbi:hypothetical protein D3C87_2071430 [compost metagenome]